MTNTTALLIRCSRCETDLDPEAFNESSRRQGDWCRACRSQYMKERKRIRACKRCGQMFERWQDYAHPGSAATHCHDCYLTKVRERMTPDRTKQRTTPAGPTPGSLRRDVLASETHCGICGEWVDQTIKWPDRGSPTIDHIIPTSFGGAELDRANVRLAHHGCNGDHYRRLVGELQEWTWNRLQFMAAGQWLGDKLAII